MIGIVYADEGEADSMFKKVNKLKGSCALLLALSFSDTDIVYILNSQIEEQNIYAQEAKQVQQRQNRQIDNTNIVCTVNLYPLERD